MLKNILILIASLLVATPTLAQGGYAPAPGMPGTTAIHPDSNIIVGWATHAQVHRSYINMADTTATFTHLGQTSNRAFSGQPTDALHHPDSAPAVSLGDGGTAIVSFEHPLANGPGFDFVVFENGFTAQGQYFLELGTVSVSSNGVRFVGFPAYSATPTHTQTPSFGVLKPENLHQLAGKYPAPYGTPFDLEALTDCTQIDLNHITHIKITDVVGSVNPTYGTTDANGHLINDPYPTAFHTGGFDLDAVGVIHYQTPHSAPKPVLAQPQLGLYPNPVAPAGHITLTWPATPQPKPTYVGLYSLSGSLINQWPAPHRQPQQTIVAPAQPGVYLLRCQAGHFFIVKKIIVQ